MNRRKYSKSNGPGKRTPEILNVRVQQTLSMRKLHQRRMLVLGFKIAVLVLGLGMSAVLLSHAFTRAFVESDHFTLNRIELVTNGRIDRAQVLTATGVREGANLLKLDLVRIEAAARSLPQVESAVVERILPDALKIELRERVPVAWISCLPSGWRPRTATNGLLADRDGKLFRCESLSPDLLGLPVLELREATNLQAGGTLPGGPPSAALQLLAELATRFDPDLPDLRQLSVRNGYSLEATLGSGEVAWLSPDQTIDDFHRLAAIVGDFQRRDQRVAFANLLPRKNIAIRLAAPEATTTMRAREVREPNSPPAQPTKTNRSSPELRAILNRR